MNKKIFAALASATMALSATGSLAVFAEDFDVVTEAVGDNGVGSGVIIPNSGIEINVENFPDDGFREAILNSSTSDTKFLDADGNEINTFPTTYGSKIKKSLLESVVSIQFGQSVKDTTGVQYFTNLVTASTNKATSNALKTVDLSENKKLENVDFEYVPDLTTLSLPKTDKVENVTIIGGEPAGKTSPIAPAEYVKNPAAHAPINELDLSSNKGLENVVIVGTNITKLDLSNNGYLTYVNVAGNKINTLDLTNNYVMKSLYCNNNELYSLDVPNTDKLIDLVASDNILQELDLTGLTGVENLFVNNNELRHIDLSENTNLYNLNVSKNHLGSLDLSANKGLHGFTINPQVVYIDSSFDGINLPDSFPEMDKDNVSVDDSSVWDKKTGVLTVSANTQTYSYDTGCEITTPDLSEPLKVSVMKESVLNRLYNPNSGEHFYTSDVEEKDALVNLGWHDEGIGWTAPTKSNTPVYRLYNPNAGDHHYTASASERDILVSVGWKFEGTGWYSYTESVNYPDFDKAIASIDVVREYNPNAKAAGAHNYTVNHAENDFLVSVGWLDEGVAWKAMK